VRIWCLQIYLWGGIGTRTVLVSATDLMLDAMREFDETERSGSDSGDKEANERPQSFCLRAEPAEARRTPTVYFIDTARRCAK